MNTTLKGKLQNKLPDRSVAETQAVKAISPIPHREQLAVLLIGSAEGVRENIHELHQRGYAEAGSWSSLLPAPNPGEVMSVLIRYRMAS